MKGMKFLMLSPLRELTVITDKPTCPQCGAALGRWKKTLGSQAKTPRDSLPFLFSRQRKGHIELRTTEPSRSFMRVESSRTLGNRLMWAGHLVPAISNNVDTNGRMLEVWTAHQPPTPLSP